MAELNVERVPRRSIGPWIIGILAIAVAIWFVGWEISDRANPVTATGTSAGLSPAGGATNDVPLVRGGDAPLGAVALVPAASVRNAPQAVNAYLGHITRQRSAAAQGLDQHATAESLRRLHAAIDAVRPMGATGATAAGAAAAAPAATPAPTADTAGAPDAAAAGAPAAMPIAHADSLRALTAALGRENDGVRQTALARSAFVHATALLREAQEVRAPAAGGMVDGLSHVGDALDPRQPLSRQGTAVQRYLDTAGAVLERVSAGRR